jgi:hypothetical protein
MVSNITIDRGVPIVRGQTFSRMEQFRQTLTAMEPGDSFLVKTISERQHAYCAASELNIKITTRRTNHGWRIWKVPPPPIRPSITVQHGVRIS